MCPSQVTVGGVTWYVAHRYTEFLALKAFLQVQNPFVAEIKDGLEQRFPPKAVGLTFRPGALAARVEGLGGFLVHFLKNARYGRQTSVDAVCSFLAVSAV